MIAFSAFHSLWLCMTFFVTSYAALIGFDANLTQPGDTVVLSCAQNPPTGDTLFWTRNNVRVKNATDRYYIDPLSNNLTIYKVGESDVGVYQCNGPSNEQVDVKLLSRPVVSQLQKPNMLTEGDTLTLTCQTWGWPVPRCVWFRGSDALVAGGDSKVTFKDVVSSVTNLTIANAQLIIASMKRSGQMDYTCSAINDVATTNTSAYIRVKDRLAALWPAIGIVIIVVLTVIIIFVVERKRRDDDSKLHPQ